MLRRYQQLFVSLLLVFVSWKVLALLTVNRSTPGPIVTLPYGSFQGRVVENLVEYLGIPFAAPPYVYITRPFLILTCGAVLVNFDLGSHNLLYLSMGFAKQQPSELHVLSEILH